MLRLLFVVFHKISFFSDNFFQDFYLAVFQQLFLLNFIPSNCLGFWDVFGSNNNALPNHLFFFTFLCIFIMDSDAASVDPPITRSLAIDPCRISCHIFLCHISNVTYAADILVNISGVIITSRFFGGDSMY